MRVRRPLVTLLLWLPAAAWYGLIWSFSSQTATQSSGTSDSFIQCLLARLSAAYRGLDPEAQRAVVDSLSFFVRKCAHMFLYFVLTGLLLLALWRLIGHTARRAAAAAALCALLAGLDEFHQTFVPGRSGQLRDVLVDLAGGLCFLLLWQLARSLYRKRRGAEGPS